MFKIIEQTFISSVVFDAASCYAHDEFDLGIATMFGGFPQAFWDSYFRLIPKQPRWDERNDLYQLFHYLNHWCVFTFQCVLFSVVDGE